MRTLITGASGYLGLEFLKSVIEDEKKFYLLLVRDKAFQRLSKQLKNYPHIELAKGSLHHPDLFIDTRKLEKAKKEVTHIIHLGALYDLKAPKEKLYKSNVIGTQNVLFFCDQCSQLKGLTYASTIAIAGDASGPFSENDFDLGQKFQNPYAQTKYEAEALVRDWSSRNVAIQVDVLRFGVIVGHSKTGEFTKEDGPYYFFKNIGNLFSKVPALTKLQVVPFPFNGKAIFPMVTVDEAAMAIKSVSGRKHLGLSCFHVISKNAPTMKRFLEDFLGSLNRPMKVIALPSNRMAIKVLEKALEVFDMPSALIDYLYLKVNFRCENYENLTGRENYENYKDVFFLEIKKRYLADFPIKKYQGRVQ